MGVIGVTVMVGTGVEGGGIVFFCGVGAATGGAVFVLALLDTFGRASATA